MVKEIEVGDIIDFEIDENGCSKHGYYYGFIDGKYTGTLTAKVVSIEACGDFKLEYTNDHYPLLKRVNKLDARLVKSGN